MKNLFDLTKEELAAQIVEQGGKKFNAVQIFNWIYKNRVTSFSVMSNLSKLLRPRLEAEFELSFLNILKVQKSKNEDAVKYLFELADGKKIESVLMLQPYGNTLCVSTQVGCAYGCFMCATGKMGLSRNLLPGEIVGQLLTVEKERGVKVQNIVFMGMGEPLANYENLKKSIDIFSDSDGININQRRITVSTCGIIPGIKRLIDDKLRVRLSISLHSTFDKVRDKIVPVNKKYNIAALLNSLKEYCSSTKLELTIEYVLIEDMNDDISEVENLIVLIRKYNLDAKVNIIPVNSVGGLTFRNEERINLWQKKLENAKIISTVRIERGADILAACGQLAGEV
ncbi:MAG: 23S rRNA (adenine(2503)-C(2))-methyltransferase RlmN [Candidatus Firestonebacteria bacterium]|nr:23S rRNA (adenine(2503)-C(2))-methyltransferase RlmN [Candidatus Firestonebacteria bacterium]